jgi:hypothetical protein
VEVLNSWGEAWGSSGYIWVRYADVLRFTVGAYALSDAAPVSYRKEVPAELVSAESGVADTSAWRVMSDFHYKCGNPAETISRFKGLDPALLID